MRVPTCYCFLVIQLLMKTAVSLDDEISQWIYGLRTLLKGCPQIPWRNSDQQDLLLVIRYCLQHRAIVAVDTLLMDDVIPILDGINLVRYEEDRPYNYTTNNNQYDRNETKNNTEDTESTESDKGWQAELTKKLTHLFRSHVLKIDFDQVSKVVGLSTDNSTEDVKVEEDDVDVVHGRRRRHKRKNMMVPMMMMGFLFMGTVLIPMGFQFLAVLGGKALILAKMALMLSSIQGLKKIATSGVNYGLYHSPGGHNGWHERSGQETNNKPPIQFPYPSYNARGQSSS